MGRGEETGFQIEQRNWDEESEECRRIVLDFGSLIHCSAFTRVTACTLALSPIRDTHSKGFSHFVTTTAAPVACGWSGCRVGLAPTGKRRLARRTPEADIG